MRVLATLLALSITSCVLQKIEQGHVQDVYSEKKQEDVPTGCANQVAFVKEKRIEGEYSSGTYGNHRHYSYKSQSGCNASVTISHDAGVASDPIIFMDTKNISCDIDSDGSLLLNFPHSKHEEYQKIKFPCDTKEIAITKMASWDEYNDYVSKLIEESRLLNRIDKKEDKGREPSLRWRPMAMEWYLGSLGIWILDRLQVSLMHGARLTIRGYDELFSDRYKTFMKKVLGGIVIVYASHRQTTLHNHPYSDMEIGTEGHPYGAIGVNKEGSVVYHITVDKDGKKQLLYPKK